MATFDSVRKVLSSFEEVEEKTIHGSHLNGRPKSRAQYRHILADQQPLVLGRFFFDIGDDFYLGIVCHRIFIRRVDWALTG
jgi:hypothetical protein